MHHAAHRSPPRLSRNARASRLVLTLAAVRLLAGCASRAASTDASARPDGAALTDAVDRAPSFDAGTDALPDAALPDDDATPPPDTTLDGLVPDAPAPPACTGRAGMAGEFDRTIHVDGRDRRFLLHVPGSYDPTRAAMLVFNLHGFTDTPEGQERISHLFQVADERGFIAVNPAGVGNSWNGGVCCGLAQVTGVDDVHFLRVLLDQLADEYCVDPTRVYAMGFSNGGFLSHRLGCEMSDRITAVGPVAGEMGVSPCSPGRPVPVVMVHGTADPVVPYGGNPLLGYPSTATTIMGWVTRNGCDPTGHEVYRNGAAHCDQYSGCARGADVVLCTVDGLDHAWPGGGSLWTADGGRPMGFIATDYLVDFFARHPRP